MKNRPAAFRVRPQFEELEPRILYSADAGAILNPDAITNSAEVRILDFSSTTSNAHNTAQASNIKSEIAFVDTRVKNYQQLIDDITSQHSDSRHIEVEILDSQLDGIQQITNALAGRNNVSAIHLITEGNTAELLLGNSIINQESINGIYGKNLIEIGSSLSKDADILIYGCNFGSGTEGELAMQSLADMTGADIAASNDKTGHSTVFANWNLEVNIGNIETDVAVSAWGQQQWLHSLDLILVFNTADTGAAGTLRWAINEANLRVGYDTITFNFGSAIFTINLTSQLPSITDAVLIENSYRTSVSQPSIIINGQGIVQDGLQLYAGSSGSTVRDIVFQNFTQDAIDISGSDNNTIVGNWFGVDATGTVAASNQQGVNIWNGSNNTIGGTTAADRNVISGSTGSAIFIGHDGLAPSNNNKITGNYIGTNITGSSAIVNNYGIYIQNSANTIIGASPIGARNIISASTNSNITLDGPSASNSVIQNNYIGTDVTGMFDLNGSASVSGQSGITLMNGANNNLIGTNANGVSDTAERNLISGNNWVGIDMIDANTSNNSIQGNWIGVNATGNAALGNSAIGVSVYGSSSGNKIGSGLVGAGNVISGNDIGVWLAEGANNNSVQGNMIGLGANGSTVVANANHGIELLGGNLNTLNVTGNVIGTNGDGPNDINERNIISGNGGTGISIHTAYVTSNTIAGNYIGTDATGLLARGNGLWGVDIVGAGSGMVIGGATSAQRNVLAGNLNWGALAINNTQNVTVTGNYFGVGADGTTTLGNNHGIYLLNTTTGSRIGGVTATEANIVANNTVGIVVGSTTSQVSILGNAIYNNTNQGIDIGSGGNGDNTVLTNDYGDTDTGANNLQNFPVLTSAASTPSDTIISGTLNSNASTTYRIEFFSTPSGNEDASGYGEGKTYLGYQDVTTDGAGNATINSTLLGITLASGDRVSATATEKAGASTYVATSEFAMNVIASFANTPPAGIDGSINVTEDTNYVFTPADFGFTDVDSNSLFRVIITTLPTQGTLNYIGSAFPAGNYITLFSLQSGEFTYTPPPDANGNALTSFTFQIQDDGGTANGGVDTDQTPNTLTINVSPVNDAPMLFAPPNTGNKSKSTINIFSTHWQWSSCE